jgi:hypothetical protein
MKKSKLSLGASMAAGSVAGVLAAALAVVLPAGCASSARTGSSGAEHDKAGNPPTRSIVEYAAGPGSPLSWVATGRGWLYLYDMDMRRIEFEDSIHGQDTIRVDPVHNVMTINAHTVPTTHNLVEDHHYRLYYLR